MQKSCVETLRGDEGKDVHCCAARRTDATTEKKINGRIVAITHASTTNVIVHAFPSRPDFDFGGCVLVVRVIDLSRSYAKVKVIQGRMSENGVD